MAGWQNRLRGQKAKNVHHKINKSWVYNKKREGEKKRELVDLDPLLMTGDNCPLTSFLYVSY